jgi:thiol:disulfide interchange protein
LNEAVERCEVSGVPLCAGCLWYTEDGRRVSERVAKRLADQKVVVIPPRVYLDQLGAVIELPRLPEAPAVTARHRNGNDLVALLAGISGILSIATCFGVGLAVCAPPLPLVPLLLGAVGLAGARRATQPEQARMLAWLGIAGGAGYIALALLLVTGALAFGLTGMLQGILVPGGP